MTSTLTAPPDITGDFHLVARRGRHRRSMVVRGSLSGWLCKHGAKLTGVGGVYNVGGWLVTCNRVSPDGMAAMHRIFDRAEYAPAAPIPS